jgi:RimJ/RimL family protein N-acetyltransferase
MTISLRKFTDKDLQVYKNWIEEIRVHQYMSRFYPRNFNGRDVENSNLYVWYIIVLDGSDVGTIWLEKENTQNTFVTLGILIGQEDKLGTGIGRKAIPIAIKQASEALSFKAVTLNVRKTNTRAIDCYEYCGFKIVKEGQKINQQGEKISFFEMQLSLSTQKIESS